MVKKTRVSPEAFIRVKHTYRHLSEDLPRALA